MVIVFSKKRKYIKQGNLLLPASSTNGYLDNPENLDGWIVPASINVAERIADDNQLRLAHSVSGGPDWSGNIYFDRNLPVGGTVLFKVYIYAYAGNDCSNTINFYIYNYEIYHIWVADADSITINTFFRIRKNPDGSIDLKYYKHSNGDYNVTDVNQTISNPTGSLIRFYVSLYSDTARTASFDIKITPLYYIGD